MEVSSRGKKAEGRERKGGDVLPRDAASTGDFTLDVARAESQQMYFVPGLRNLKVGKEAETGEILKDPYPPLSSQSPLPL